MKTLTKVLSVFIIIVMLCGVCAVAEDNDYAVMNINYFKSSFEKQFALGADDDNRLEPSVWLLYGLKAAGLENSSEYDFMKPVVSETADYTGMGSGDIAKDILAKALYGSYDMKNAAAALCDLQQQDGSFTNTYGYSSVTDTAWSMLALKIAKSTEYNHASATAYLKAQQKTDGGFTDYGEVGNVDSTGMVMNALAVFDDKTCTEIMKGCVAYLDSVKTAEGLYVGHGEYDSANSCSQAYAIIGLTCAGVKVDDNAVNALLGFMQENGGFWYDEASKNGSGWYSAPDWFSTYEGVMALCNLRYGNLFVKLAQSATTKVTTAELTTIAAADYTTVAAAAIDPDDVPTGNKPLNPWIIVVLIAAIVILLLTLLPKFRKK